MKLMTLTEASKILGISRPLLRARIRRGALPVARYNPMRLAVRHVFTYAANMPPVLRRGPAQKLVPLLDDAVHQMERRAARLIVK